VNYIDVSQRSDGWIEERMGSVGASEVFDATAKQKSGKYYAKRDELLYKKLVERIGIQNSGYVSSSMRHGIETEASARTAYEFAQNVTVKEVGIFRHNRLRAHASPDGVLANSNIGLEVKCPQSYTHLRTLMTGEIPENYLYQIMWQICCAGMDAVDYVSYDPRFPVKSQLFIKRVHRDNEMIAEMESEVEKFLSELDLLEAKFNAQYSEAA